MFARFGMFRAEVVFRAWRSDLDLVGQTRHRESMLDSILTACSAAPWLHVPASSRPSPTPGEGGRELILLEHGESVCSDLHHAILQSDTIISRSRIFIVCA